MKLSTDNLALLGMSLPKARVYVAALELGSATMQALSRKSGVNRSTIYTFIEELKNDGTLYETRKKRRKMYTAVDPDTIVARERARVHHLQKLLPELEAIHNEGSYKPKVTYYEGMDGIEEVYKDMLKEKEPIVAYEDVEHLRKGLPHRIFEWFPQERARCDVSIQAISRDSKIAREFSKQNMRFLRTNKYISVQDLKTDINVYGNKVALMDVRGKKPFCVLIENKNLADTMRILWKELWERVES